MTDPARPLVRQSTDTVPRWQYEAWKRWFLPSEDAQKSREIKAEAERQAGER